MGSLFSKSSKVAPMPAVSQERIVGSAPATLGALEGTTPMALPSISRISDPGGLTASKEDAKVRNGRAAIALSVTSRANESDL